MPPRQFVPGPQTQEHVHTAMVQTTTTKTLVSAPRPAAGLVGLGPNFEVPLQKGVALSCRGTPTSEAVEVHQLLKP